MRAFVKELLVQCIILFLLVGTIMPGFSMFSANKFLYPILGSAFDLTSQTASAIPFLSLNLSDIFSNNTTYLPAAGSPTTGPLTPVILPTPTPTPAPVP